MPSWECAAILGEAEALSEIEEAPAGLQERKEVQGR
jgi:hypothetical protein